MRHGPNTYSNADWPTEAARGRRSRMIDGKADPAFYERLHSWERNQGSDLDRARLNETRGIHDSLDYIGCQIENLVSRLSMGERNTKHLFKTFDRMLDVLEMNANSSSPADLGKMLAETGMVSGLAKSVRVLELIRNSGVLGVTDSEGATKAKMNLENYRSVRGRLKNEGLVVATRFKRKSDQNRLQTVWISNASVGQLQEILDDNEAHDRGII